jgi:hypothetical protein
MPKIRAFRDEADQELWRVTYEGDEGTLAHFLSLQVRTQSSTRDNAQSNCNRNSHTMGRANQLPSFGLPARWATVLGVVVIGSALPSNGFMPYLRRPLSPSHSSRPLSTGM